MKYFSIDIEATGLNPKDDDILQLGIVYDDLTKPLWQLPRLNLLYKKGRYSGSPEALAMNVKTFQAILNPPEGAVVINDYREMDMLATGFIHRFDTGTITIAGKNFAGYDDLFLKHRSVLTSVKRHRRVLDPGSMFVKACDDVPPDLKECCVRAGIELDNQHDAIADCLAVISLVRSFLNE